jgi:hypothetical protein
MCPTGIVTQRERDGTHILDDRSLNGVGGGGRRVRAAELRDGDRGLRSEAASKRDACVSSSSERRTRAAATHASKAIANTGVVVRGETLVDWDTRPLSGRNQPDILALIARRLRALKRESRTERFAGASGPCSSVACMWLKIVGVPGSSPGLAIGKEPLLNGCVNELLTSRASQSLRAAPWIIDVRMCPLSWSGERCRRWRR